MQTAKRSSLFPIRDRACPISSSHSHLVKVGIVNHPLPGGLTALIRQRLTFILAQLETYVKRNPGLTFCRARGII